jgi:hypothetical protein
MQYYSITCPRIFLEEAEDIFKTGDIIVFKASNNFNSIFHGSYFGHMGIVYIDPNDPTHTPMLFEANGVERMPLMPRHPTCGIFLTPLSARISKYKGRCFLKQLEEPLREDIVRQFGPFIDYCLANFQYDKNIGTSALKKYLGFKRCDSKTDCGQIVFLSLIKLGLLSIEDYDKPIFHHLLHVAKLKEVTNNYYRDLVEIVDHPFDSSI